MQCSHPPIDRYKWTNIKDICVNCGLLMYKEPTKPVCRTLIQWKTSTEEEKNNLDINYCLTKYRYKNFFPSHNLTKPKRIGGIKYNFSLGDFLEFYNKNLSQKYKDTINLILDHFRSF